MVGIGKSVAGASHGVMPNTLKALTNARLFVVDPHQTMIMSVHFESGRSANSQGIGTFRSEYEYEYDYEFEFSFLSTRTLKNVDLET